MSLLRALREVVPASTACRGCSCSRRSLPIAASSGVCFSSKSVPVRSRISRNRAPFLGSKRPMRMHAWITLDTSCFWHVWCARREANSDPGSETGSSVSLVPVRRIRSEPSCAVSFLPRTHGAPCSQKGGCAADQELGSRNKGSRRGSRGRQTYGQACTSRVADWSTRGALPVCAGRQPPARERSINMYFRAHGKLRALLLAAVVGSYCCAYGSSERNLRRETKDAAAPAPRSRAALEALNAVRQLAAVEVDTEKGHSSATGGSLFAMEKIRTYEGTRLPPPETKFPAPLDSEMCERWAVLTSIFEPTDTVRQLGAAEGWCVVVVGDQNGPAEYNVEGVIYLTPEDQEKLPYRIVSLLPWNHFGRKNIGYLYAVHHGATVIYDVDDDNALISPEAGVPHALSPFTPASTTSFAVGPEAFVHNPYGCFGGPANVWPRGFPLDSINDADSNRCDEVAVDPADESGPPEEGWRLGVVQALANHDPDVDAVYRLTYPPGGLPFDFEVPEPVPEGMSPLKIVPPAAFTPYNAQATLHFPPAFWGMLLPVTVHGRVSDIWRSYFTQTLLPSTGAVTAFAPAWVEQIRNPHNYLADFQAELPLYEQSGALVAFLDGHRRQSAAASEAGVGLPERIDALMVEMYEYGVIEEADVQLSQAWLEDLYSVGYNPSTTG